MRKRPAVKLTIRSVKNLEPGDRDYFVSDSVLQNFCVKVTKAGRKIFNLNYRDAAGKQRRLRIGDFEAITPDDARTKARQVVGRIAEGSYPGETTPTKGHLSTIGDMLLFYRDEHCVPNQCKVMLRIINHCMLDSTLASLPLNATLTSANVSAAFHELTYRGVDGATRKELSPSYKKHARDALSAAWNFAVKHERTDVAPKYQKVLQASRKRIPPSKKVARPITPEQYSRIFKALEDLASAGNRNPFALMLLEACLWTGIRSGEMAKAKVNNLDLRSGILELPEHKNAYHDAFENRRPLPRNSLAVFKRALEEREKRQITLEQSPYIFVSLKGNRWGYNNGKNKIHAGPMSHSFQNVWREIRSECGIPKHVLHNTRSGVINVLLRAGRTVDEISAFTEQTPRSNPKVLCRSYEC